MYLPCFFTEFDIAERERLAHGHKKVDDLPQSHLGGLIALLYCSFVFGFTFSLMES